MTAPTKAASTAHQAHSIGFRSPRVMLLAFPFVLLLTAMVAVPLRVLHPHGLPRYRALKQELREVRSQNALLRAQVRRLQWEVQGLRTDPTMLERVARDELGMIAEGEVIVQFAP
jgi:cell division protein FtsB